MLKGRHQLSCDETMKAQLSPMMTFFDLLKVIPQPGMVLKENLRQLNHLPFWIGEWIPSKIIIVVIVWSRASCLSNTLLHISWLDFHWHTHNSQRFSDYACCRAFLWKMLYPCISPTLSLISLTCARTEIPPGFTEWSLHRSWFDDGCKALEPGRLFICWNKHANFDDNLKQPCKKWSIIQYFIQNITQQVGKVRQVNAISNPCVGTITRTILNFDCFKCGLQTKWQHEAEQVGTLMIQRMNNLIDWLNTRHVRPFLWPQGITTKVRRNLTKEWGRRLPEVLDGCQVVSTTSNSYPSGIKDISSHHLLDPWKGTLQVPGGLCVSLEVAWTATSLYNLCQ